MNGICVSKTKENTKRYPLHRHNTWEVMYYVSGSGYLATADKPIPFREGTIILVPSGVVHGSVSENGFVNISVGCDFGGLFRFDKPLCLRDTPDGEGGMLAELIYRNRGVQGAYLSALCTAYAYFLLQQVEDNSPIERAVFRLAAHITEGFSAPSLSPSDWIRRSGYAPDYLRAVFKRVTGLTPVAFLTRTRIDHACKLLEIYGHSLSVEEVGQKCGFEDGAYFSRRFKQLMGCSPDCYRRERYR